MLHLSNHHPLNHPLNLGVITSFLTKIEIEIENGSVIAIAIGAGTGTGTESVAVTVIATVIGNVSGNVIVIGVSCEALQLSQPQRGQRGRIKSQSKGNQGHG
ncbi:uncharacterized protein DNG_01136 [Cephalotrichum gorgonifer]|uniref:Uncharacterized protein n=1 Tax=Cephalotrichum gorgonifer TaxID=2041049 RepID=A0AAE8MRB7_9PEZI|nr:uncharacterized protein DNG_01136 [Cephalotrichum gorgonifer]